MQLQYLKAINRLVVARVEQKKKIQTSTFLHKTMILLFFLNITMYLQYSSLALQKSFFPFHLQGIPAHKLNSASCKPLF